MEEGAALFKKMEGRDILLRFEEGGGRGDHGKEDDVPDTGSGDEDSCIFPAEEEHCGELNGRSPTIT